MTSPRDLIIEDAAYAMDGGSIFLSLRDEAGLSHTLILVQHRIPMIADDPRVPGRLYLNNRIIKVRSDEERELLAELKSASILPGNIQSPAPKKHNNPSLVTSDDIEKYQTAISVSPEEAIHYLVHSLVEFVESGEYIRLHQSLIT